MARQKSSKTTELPSIFASSAEQLGQEEREAFAPLAGRMRPKRIEEVIGQRKLLEKGKPLYTMVQTGKLHSMILWGPPGTGKTTIANILANAVQAKFFS